MSDPINELAAALVKAQAAIQPALKDKTNPAFRSRYADLTAIWDACREALTSNGLCVIQMPHDSAESGRVALTTILLHTSGQQISTTVSAPLVKQDAQGVGSALTYLRRYSLAAMVGVVTDDDDDGNAASKRAEPAAYQPRQSAPTPPANGGMLTTDDARHRFFIKFATVIHGDTWSAVQKYLDTQHDEPASAQEWIEAGKRVAAAMHARAAELDEVPA